MAMLRWKGTRARLPALSLAAVMLGGCAGGGRPRVFPPVSSPAPESPGIPALIRVRTIADGQRQILALPLEEYVLAAALSELAPSSGDPDTMRRMYAVQAIVVRTYAVSHLGRHAGDGFDLCDTTHCQLVELDRRHRSRWAPVAREGVRRTRGAVLQYRGRPAAILFHSDCGGHRSAATDVWGGTGAPYLGGGADPLPDGAAHAAWRFVVERDELRLALNAEGRTAVGARLDGIHVQRRDAAGRAALVVLNGTRAPLVRGEDFRAAVSQAFGPRALRSTMFDVHREGQTFVFEGHGFGHGVGLCQTGALARAAAGDTAERILAFYFPGTTLSGR
jgi:stage II sporulation protein D